ncbi:MAG: endo-1,4-beta-xylanase [Limisphaerales bacterium]
MNRRSFLKSTLATAAFATTPFALRAKKELSEADIVGAARERIPKIRTGKISIRVRDAKGRAIPGARIKVQQTKHEFLFGASSSLVSGAGGGLEQEYIHRFTGLLNFATLQFYWASYEAERGRPSYAHTDYVADWARKNNITCKGHPLVWQHEASVPSWLPNEFKEIERLSKQRVHDLVSRYAGKIDYWDVVNEAHYMLNKAGKHPTLIEQFARSVGVQNYLTEHLHVARDANPKAKLIVNDNRPDQQYFDMLQPLRRKFDVIGMQSHMHDGTWPMQKVWNFCEKFSKLGLPIHFTETTVLSGKKLAKEKFEATTPGGEAAQAEYVANFYTVLFGHPSVEAITWWDFSDLGAWLNAPSGLLRADMSPKPAYDRLHSLIRGEWWTKVDAEANHGRLDLRAFSGTHEVTASTPDNKQISATVVVKRGEHAHCDLTLPS